ncbi:MAG: hypothetical protein H8D23_23240 [Candidatus Brocadiales bacterium]|nr:hypothetical protein [Candidatus Brocadiales bacterium]
MLGKIVILFFGLLLLQAKPVLGQMNISNQIRDIHVFDDKGDGVESELFKIDDVGIRSSLGLTDKNGYKQVYLLCKSEDQIGAIPQSEEYFQRMINCTKNKTIKLELGKKELYKLIFNGNKEINAQIIAMDPERIEIVLEDSTKSITVNFKEFDKILEARNYISPGKIAGRTVAGAGVGAGIGAIFFGIGAIPGAIIGSISGGATSPASIEYGNDVLPKYYTPESSLRQNLNY